MRVYDVGGVSDAELIKTKPKTPARVAPPLTAAEQRHVAERLVRRPRRPGAVARVRAQSLRTPAPVRWRRRSMRRPPLAAGLGLRA